MPKLPYGTKARIVRSLPNWREAPARELVANAKQKGFAIHVHDVYSTRSKKSAVARVPKAGPQAAPRVQRRHDPQLAQRGNDAVQTFSTLAVRLGLDRARAILDALEARTP